MIAGYNAEEQRKAPLYEQVMAYINEETVPFHMPGHMMGRAGDEALLGLMGRQAMQADITQVLEMDDIHRPYNGTSEAQRLAAQAYGAKQTWFLVNGSTCGNMAMIMACANPGEEIIVPRSSHRSVYAGLVMSGAKPVYARTPYDEVMMVNHCVEPEEVERLLALHSQVKACLITGVTPYGACANSQAIAALLHKKKLPLLVDEAWGPHLRFADGLPISALQQGADLVVQSAHKLLTALSQASFLHLQGELVSAQRVSQILRMTQTTSPSYLLMISLDLARRQAALYGQSDWQRALDNADRLRAYIEKLPGLKVYGPGRSFAYDRTRLVVSAAPLGWGGLTLERYLRYRLKIQPEMSDGCNVVFVITPAHTQDDIAALEQAMLEISGYGQRLESDGFARRPFLGSDAESLKLKNMKMPDFPEMVLTPREAFYSECRRLPYQDTVGKICGELVTPYPPGIPLLCPGERITSEHLDYIKAVYDYGLPLEGLSDASLQTLRIIDEA